MSEHSANSGQQPRNYGKMFSYFPDPKKHLDAAHGRAKDLPVDKTARLLAPVLFPMSSVTTCNSRNHPELSLIHLLIQDNVTLVLS